MPDTAVKSAETALEIKRIFDAPLARVYKAWSDPIEASKWLGPGGWSGTIKVADMRPGGSYMIEMRHTDGDVMVATGTYRDVVPQQKLVYTWAWRGDDGKPGRETLITVTFRAVGQKTELTLKHEGFDGKEARDNHKAGWNGCFDKLVEFLKTESK